MSRRVVGAAIAVALLVAACGAFIGPATQLDETYFFPCGAVKCRIGWEECSSGKPHLCIPAAGVARDAGARDEAPKDAGDGG